MEERTRNISTFIFVHNQDIILDYINVSKFTNLPNLKYVFLGKGSINKIKNINNIIVARDLQPNIEFIPKLTAYTGWFALIKNKLIQTEYVNMFEYDINCSKNINEHIEQTIIKSPDFIGYFPMRLDDPIFMDVDRYIKEFKLAFDSKSKTPLKTIINAVMSKPNAFWSSTSNSTWKTNTLIKYVEWFSEYIEYIKHSVNSGHMFERSISVYFIIQKLNAFIVSGAMDHLQLNTHTTTDILDKNRFNTHYKYLINNE